MSEWKTYRLGDLCDSISNTYRGKAQNVVLINTSDVLEGKCLNHRKEPNKNLKGQFKKTFQQGDILYSEIRPSNKRFAYIDFDATDYIASTKLMVLRANEKIRPLYLYYILQSQVVIDELQMLAESRSGTFPQITFSELSLLTTELPDIDSQDKIINILKSLDDKIELNRRINANLEAQAQALFRSWFVDFEPFRDGPFVDSELGKIPASLKIEHIGNIPHKIESGKRPKGGASEHGIPSIGAENIKGLGIYDYAKTKFIPEDFASTMKKGKINGYELLIYKDGGKPGYFIPNFTIFGEGFPYKEMYINEHVFCLDFFDKGFNTFAYFYMRTPYIMNQLNTIGGKAAIPGINTKDIESLPIFTNENEKVKEFGTLFLPTIKTILQNCVENKTLSALRDTLLPKLMAGEIKI